MLPTVRRWFLLKSGAFALGGLVMLLILHVCEMYAAYASLGEYQSTSEAVILSSISV
ncbi:MAG: hypothetical protein RIT20_370 [Pseudomonadota bacterium]|jgi:hypothetical protein